MTLDALHTSATTVTEIVKHSGGDYLLTVKNNQKTLRRKLVELFDSDVNSQLEKHVTQDKKHGRIETRTTSSIDLESSDINFPYARTALKIVRARTARNGKKKQIETTETDVYILSSISYAKLSLKYGAALARGHWSVENKLHHVKDASMMEDRSRIKNGAGRIMAATRTLITRLFSKTKGSYAQTARRISGNVNLAIKFITSESLKHNNLCFSG